MYPYYFLDLSLKSGKNLKFNTDLTVYNDGDWMLKPELKDDYIILNGYSYCLLIYDNKLKSLSCGRDNGIIDVYHIGLYKKSN